MQKNTDEIGSQLLNEPKQMCVRMSATLHNDSPQNCPLNTSNPAHHCLLISL